MAVSYTALLMDPCMLKIRSSCIQDLDSKMHDIRLKITKERKMMDAAQAMKRASTNEDVRNDCDKRLRESTTNMQYFENLLRELENRASSSSVSLASSASVASSSTAPTSVSSANARGRALPMPPGQQGRPGMDPYGRQGTDSSLSVASSSRTSNTQGRPSDSPLPPPPKVHYSNLGQANSHA